MKNKGTNTKKSYHFTNLPQNIFKYAQMITLFIKKYSLIKFSIIAFPLQLKYQNTIPREPNP